MRTFQHLARLVGLLFAAFLVVGACTNTEAPPSFNQAGVTFLHSMIKHHAQGVDMAKLVETRAAHDELRGLASRIAADQQREIATMQQLLAQAGAAPADETTHTMMPGMMSEQLMADLGALSGQEFDLRFIGMMTAHHQGAIDMSQRAVQEAENPQVTNLAEHIIKAQTSEIKQMAQWHQAWTS